MIGEKGLSNLRFTRVWQGGQRNLKQPQEAARKLVMKITGLVCEIRKGSPRRSCHKGTLPMLMMLLGLVGSTL